MKRVFTYVPGERYWIGVYIDYEHQGAKEGRQIHGIPTVLDWAELAVESGLPGYWGIPQISAIQAWQDGRLLHEWHYNPVGKEYVLYSQGKHCYEFPGTHREEEKK